ASRRRLPPRQAEATVPARAARPRPLLHVDHRGARERAAIGGLPAAFRVERAAIEDRGGTAAEVGQRDDACGKAGQVRVAQVEAVGHGRRIVWSAATKDRAWRMPWWDAMQVRAARA